MRVSPVGWAYKDLETVLLKAKESAEVTHNHPEGIKGAQATASAIFLSRTEKSKEYIKDYISQQFDYNLDFDLEDLRENYRFNESCQDTVPQAIFTFLVSENFEDSIRKAIYIGGDSDTLACINGSITEAFYGGVPENISREVYKRLNDRFLAIVNSFSKSTLRICDRWLVGNAFRESKGLWNEPFKISKEYYSNALTLSLR